MLCYCTLHDLNKQFSENFTWNNGGFCGWYPPTLTKMYFRRIEDKPNSKKEAFFFTYVM
jgi:hypothetical protein